MYFKFIDLLTLKLHEYPSFSCKKCLELHFKNRIFDPFLGFWGNHKRKNTYFFFHLWFLSLYHQSMSQITVLMKYSCSRDWGMCWSKTVTPHQAMRNLDSGCHHSYSASITIKGGVFTWLQIPPDSSITRLHLTSCVQGCRITAHPSAFPVLLLSTLSERQTGSIWRAVLNTI